MFVITGNGGVADAVGILAKLWIILYSIIPLILNLTCGFVDLVNLDQAMVEVHW